MSKPLLCTTPRYQPHVLAGSFSRRQSGRRSPGKPHPYGSYPWYSTWVIDQGPYRVRDTQGEWCEREGPSSVVLPPYSGDRIELPVSTLFSWVEWGAVGHRRIPRTGGGPAGKYGPGKEQPPAHEIWGVDLSMWVPDALLEATRTMVFRVNILWWRGAFYQLQAHAELARWLSLLLQAQVEPVCSSDSFRGLEEEVKVLQDGLSQGIGVGEWAALLGIHPRTLHRRCLEHQNGTPHHILDRVRLERAEGMLLQPGTPIPAITKSCGFATREAFSAWFCKQQGIPPVEWRRMMLDV